MFRYRDTLFQKEMVTIHPGEFLVTQEDVVISTILGSCVAVALFDPISRRGGLNHFMLPGKTGNDSHFASGGAKYGVNAMELMINDFLKAGTKKRDLSAKVFGGGSVLGGASGSGSRVSQDNIDFAFSFLETEAIPVLGSDVGGTAARKIFFFVREDRILLKRITGFFVKAIEKEEDSYLKSIRKKHGAGPVVFFD
jgi:chemotaxis protein CheD